jgi:hypothetical protein
LQRESHLIFCGGEIAGLDRLLHPHLRYARFQDLQGILGALLAIPAAASIQIAVHEYREYRRELEAAEQEAGGPTPAPEVT